MYVQAVVAFIAKGKGLPKWFREEWIWIMINMHDSVKSVDYISRKAKDVLSPEAFKEVEKLREEYYNAIKQFNNIARIAYYCMKEKRELNAGEKEIIKAYLKSKGIEVVPES